MKAVGHWVLLEVENEETDSGIITGDGNRGRIVSYGGACCFIADILEGLGNKAFTAMQEMLEDDIPPPSAVFHGSADNPFIGAECYFSPRNAVDVEGLKCVRDEDIYCIIPLMPEIEEELETVRGYI